MHGRVLLLLLLLPSLRRTHVRDCSSTSRTSSTTVTLPAGLTASSSSLCSWGGWRDCFGNLREGPVEGKEPTLFFWNHRMMTVRHRPLKRLRWRGSCQITSLFGPATIAAALLTVIVIVVVLAKRHGRERWKCGVKHRSTSAAMMMMMIVMMRRTTRSAVTVTILTRRRVRHRLRCSSRRGAAAPNNSEAMICLFAKNRTVTKSSHSWKWRVLMLLLRRGPLAPYDGRLLLPCRC